MDKLLLLLSYIKRYKFSYGLGVICIILTNWLIVSIPQYIQYCIDLLNENLATNQEQLVEYILIIFALALGMIVVRILSRALFFNPGRAIERELKDEMFAKLMCFQKDYHDENSTGSIISRVNNDINGIRLICGFGMLQFFNILSALSLTPIKMWQLSPELTLYCTIPIIFVFTVVRFGMRYMVKSTRARMDTLQNLSGRTVSLLSGIDVLKSFGMQTWAKEVFEKENHTLFAHSYHISFLRSFIMPLLNNLENVLKILVLLIGGAFVIQADFTLGELTAFITYSALLTMPLMGLGWLTTLLQQGMVGLTSLQTILSREISHTATPRLSSLEKENLFEKGLEIRNLYFRYPGTKNPVLKNVSFRILPGQTVGIFGQIGSGKTTLVNCINRYLILDPEQIFLGDRDVANLALSDVRDTIRTVTQEPFLFSDTVEENIRFGSRDKSDSQKKPLPQILFESALEEEVQRFPEQEKTLVGEKGIMLSGGQKQRISLARALYTPCNLLILDNVLSAVDYETERFLLKQIHQQHQAKSLLIVSHRLSVLEKADLILVLEEGKIMEQGTHEELMEKSEYYRKTWELQNQNTPEYT